MKKGMGSRNRRGRKRYDIRVHATAAKVIRPRAPLAECSTLHEAVQWCRIYYAQFRLGDAWPDGMATTLEIRRGRNSSQSGRKWHIGISDWDDLEYLDVTEHCLGWLQLHTRKTWPLHRRDTNDKDESHDGPNSGIQPSARV